MVKHLHQLLFSLLLLLLPRAQSLGLVTQILTRSIEHVTPSDMTAGVVTSVVLIGKNLKKTDRVGLATTSACTTLLAAGDLTMSKDETSAQAQLVVLKASLGASLGASSVLHSHVCLQINGCQ